MSPGDILQFPPPEIVFSSGIRIETFNVFGLFSFFVYFG